ncbi:MAG: phage major capsid protein [Kiritimatiellae bacterium]|nr:phage major capsid protein [Kiritimatiellia bacterium]
MNLKEQMAQAKENLAAITAAVESGEKGADELSAAIDNVKGLQTKLDAAAEAAELMKGLDNSDSAQPAEKEEMKMEAKTLGEHFVKYRETHKDVDNRIVATPFKTAGDPTTSSGLVATQFDREPVRRAAAPLTVLDLFGRKTVSDPVYSWNVYGSTTGSVSTTSEGDTKNKLTYAYTPKTATLQKITGLIKVTEELFDDAPYIVDAINQDLVDDLNANRQAQAVATLLATSGIQTDSVSYTSEVDIFKAIIDAAADIEDETNIPADAVVVTPAIWKVLRGAVDKDGHFYAGDPFGDSEYGKLFEMTFVKNANVTSNHIIVGAFARGAELVSKGDGVRVDSTNSNDVDFEKNLVSIRAEAREILAVKRPACFCNITVSASGATGTSN